MRRYPALAAIPLLALSLPALAQGIDPAIDADGDGAYSFPELQAVAPELTDATFGALDTNGDGLVDAAEAEAAVAAGLWPVPAQ